MLFFYSFELLEALKIKVFEKKEDKTLETYLKFNMENLASLNTTTKI